MKNAGNKTVIPFLKSCARMLPFMPEPRTFRDHWLVLILFFAEVLPILVKTYRRPVVFLRHVALGDIICTFPAASKLKTRHPGNAFIYVCKPAFTLLPRIGGITNHVRWAPTELLETTYSFLFAAIYKFDYGDERQNSVSMESVVAENCRQHGVPIVDEHPALALQPGNVLKVRKKLEEHGLSSVDLILIHPGPTWHVREWPIDAWTRLVEELSSNGFTNIVQLGSGQKGEVGSALDRPIPKVASLVNRLELDETIALISLGRILIGVDSGLLHLAVSVGTPALGIFGPTSPELRFSARHSETFPTAKVPCQGCHHRLPRLHWQSGCPFDIRCMKSIAPTTVLRHAMTILRKSPEAVT